MPTRRDFVASSALVGGAALTGFRPWKREEGAEMVQAPSAPAPLSILILGGTGFIGPHLVKHAVSRGHKVTIFTRGRRQPDLPAEVEHLIGDRNGQLQALEGKRWDVVIDDSGNVADWVRQSTELLKNAAGRYLFTSSTGVYYPYLKRGLTEADPIHYDAVDPKDGEEAFGVMKGQCERYVMQAFGDRGLVVRPIYIVGPGDTSDRFPYWPQRLARGGEVLAPSKADDVTQIIDVRDLAEFMVRLVERGRSGIYNAVGPSKRLLVRDFYQQAAAALHADVKFTFVDDYDFLLAHKIDESIPWAPLRGNLDGMMSIANAKAIAEGLTFRSLADTVKDTLAWWPSVPEARRAKPKFTITPEIEAQALADWHARGK